MRTFTEQQLRETLHAAARQVGAGQSTDGRLAQDSDSDGAHTRRRFVIPLLAAAAVAAITVPFAMAWSGPDGKPADDPVQPAASSTTPSETPTADPQRLTLAEVSRVVGYEFKAPEPGTTPVVSEQQAIQALPGGYSTGLTQVAIQTVTTDNEALGPMTTTWRLAWVIVSPPRTMWVASQKEPGEGKEATVHDAVFIDAMTGAAFRRFTF